MDVKNSIKNFLGKIRDNIKYYTVKVDKNAVFFSSFSGKSYSDNPRAISEALHRISPETKILWGFQDVESKKYIIPEYIKCINLSDPHEASNIEYSVAVIVNNCTLPYIKKSKKQYFVQTWHGDRGFKKILHDSPFAPKDYFISEEKDGYCDLAISGSKFAEKVYRSAFKYKGEILTVGTPRNDILLNPDIEKISEIKKFFGIDPKKKILLYAPTLRRENVAKKTEQDALVDINSTLLCLEKKYGNEWICLTRAHPSIKDLSGVECNRKVINVTDYEDMADLLLISDMLLTDYSSSAGDFALMNKPIVLFQSDIKEFLEKDRDFYFEMKDSPFYIASSQNQLEVIINNFTYEEIKKNCQEILAFYGTYEIGNSSEIIAQRILDWINKIN